MSRPAVFGLGLLAALALLGNHCGPHPRVVLVPSATSVARNATFTVNVETRELSPMEGFAFVLLYDPARLQLEAIPNLRHQNPNELSILPAQTLGKATVLAASATGQAGTGGAGSFLAEITFKALTAGQTTLSFERAELGWVKSPPANRPATEVQMATVELHGTTITVQ